MQTILQELQQKMPEGSSESNFAPTSPAPETPVSSEQLAAAETASARDLVEMAYGGTVAVSAETTATQQQYIDAIAPATVTPGNIVAQAEQIVTDTDVIIRATEIGDRLQQLRSQEMRRDVLRGNYGYAA